MIRLYLIRHGETDWNAQGNRYCGRTDIGLSDRGRQQAREAEKMLGHVEFDTFVASPLQRTQQTLSLAAPGQHQAVVPELTEIAYGFWEGMTPSEIASAYPSEWHIWRTDPAAIRPGETGESLAEVGVRGEMFLNLLRENDDGETVLAVGHNTFNRILIADTLGIERSNYRRIRQTNAGINIAEIDKDSVEWITINATATL